MLLTAIQPRKRHKLADAVRGVSWSHTGRLMALGADGRAMIDSEARITNPIGPDPITCSWIGSDRVAVVDGVLGAIVAGGGSVEILPVQRVVAVERADGITRQPREHERHVVLVGGDGFASVRLDAPPGLRTTTIDTGPVRMTSHLGGSIWLAGGAAGLVVVDITLGCVDHRIELPSVVSLAVAAEPGWAAAGDSTGSIHVLDLAEPTRGTELSGYPDAVRHLDIAPGGDVVVACADDELTWWTIGTDGRVSDEPECSVGHSAPITACSIGATGFVATGDLDGVVRLWSPRLRDLPLGAVHLDGEVTALAWSRSGQRLAVGSAGGDVLVADVEAGELL